MKNIALDFNGVQVMSGHITTIGPVTEHRAYNESQINNKNNTKEDIDFKKKPLYMYQVELDHGGVIGFSSYKRDEVVNHRNLTLNNTKD